MLFKKQILDVCDQQHQFVKDGNAQWNPSIKRAMFVFNENDLNWTSFLTFLLFFVSIITDNTTMITFNQLINCRILWYAVLKYLRKKFNAPFDLWKTGLNLKKMKCWVYVFFSKRWLFIIRPTQIRDIED